MGYFPRDIGFQISSIRPMTKALKINLDRLLKERGISMKKLSVEAGFGETFVRDVLRRGNDPTLAKVTKLAEILGVPLVDLLRGEENGEHQDFVSSETGANQKLKGTVPQIDVTAGMGGGGIVGEVNTEHNGIVVSADQVSGRWGLPEFIYARIGVPSARLAALPVQGDSMSPTLKDGDVIFVDTGHRSPSPDGIYALSDDFGGVIVKRLESHGGDGRVRIISDNPLHQPYERSIEEMFIFGRYVGRWTV